MTGGSGPALFVADAGPVSGLAGQVIVINPTPPYTFIGEPLLAGTPSLAEAAMSGSDRMCIAEQCMQ